jgi:hypothetical protein
MGRSWKGSAVWLIVEQAVRGKSQRMRLVEGVAKTFRDGDEDSLRGALVRQIR